jgi:septal ring factor EnvC (AmiA/AmiB activator)
MDSELDEATQKYEDSARDFEVQAAILEATRKRLETLQIEFQLKMQQADEALKYNELDEARQRIINLETELGEGGQQLQTLHAELSDLRDHISTVETENRRLVSELADADQEIDELEAESESAALALVSEVKNLESELADVKTKLDEVLYAAESETLQLREDLQQAETNRDHACQKFNALQQTNLQLSQENAKLRASVEELNLEGGWRKAAEQERVQRVLAEARLHKLEQLVRDVLDN